MGIKVERRKINGETWIKFNSEYDRIKYFYGNIIMIIALIVMVLLGGYFLYVLLNHIDLLKSNPCGLCEELGWYCTNLDIWRT